jgi:hypothetical protein
MRSDGRGYGMINITRYENEEIETLLRRRYEQIKPSLNERSRRLFVASEAQALGNGGISAVVRAIGIGRETVVRGLKELREIEIGESASLEPGRIRRKGGGRKPKSQEPGLLKNCSKL